MQSRDARVAGQSVEIELVAQPLTEAQLRSRGGDPVSALHLAEKVLQLDPDNPAALVIGGVAACRVDRCEEGTTWLRRVTELRPDDEGWTRVALEQLEQLEG